MTSFRDRKQSVIQDLTQSLIKASIISVKDASKYLEVQIARSDIKQLPTNIVFYDYPTLFNINKHILNNRFPELVGLKKDDPLPKYLNGECKLNPSTTLNNRRYFITPIVRKTEELGFEKIYIDTGGIYYHLKKDDLGPLAQSYFNLTDEIIKCCELDQKTVSNKLEEIVSQTNSCPTHGVFFSYIKLLAGKTDLVELIKLAPDAESLPELVGPYQLKLSCIFENEENFISRMVRYAKEAGFEGANVSPNGITYYMIPDKMGPKAKKLYGEFFLRPDQITKLIREQKDRKSYKMEHMVVKTYAKYYSTIQVQRVNYELRKYYNRLGYSVNLSYDWRYEVEGEPLVLKIFTDSDDLPDTTNPTSGPKLSNMALLKPRPNPSPFPSEEE